MPAHSTSQLHPSVERTMRDESQQQNLRIMIETMVRAGYSEPEITSAVERSTAPARRVVADASIWHRLRALLQG
jgi:hypothetical protein